MIMPINLDNMSTLFAISSLILLLTYEFVIPFFGRSHILVSKERIRRTTFLMGILFLFTVVIKIMQVLST